MRLPQGQLYGTLCAASASSQPLSEQAMATLQLFAGLLGQQVEREMLLSELQQRNHELSTYALTDALTGLPNRRALDEELARMWARAERTGAYVLLGFIDMDAFKPINDQHGHEAGDQLLRTVARQLRGALRDSDYAARIGGDEFVMLGVGPLVSGPLPDSALAELQHRLEQSTVCDVTLPIQQLLHYPGASVGVVAIDPRLTSSAETLHQADAAMYRAKANRPHRRRTDTP